MNPDTPQKPALLIVDDDFDQLTIFKIAAERAGVFSRIVTAETADEAVDKMFGLIDSLPTSMRKIVLTDMRMPRINGVDLVRRLRPTCDALPVSLVAMSNSESEEEVAAAKEAGCCAFFQKPGDFNQLKRIFHSLPEVCERESASWLGLSEALFA